MSYLYVKKSFLRHLLLFICGLHLFYKAFTTVINNVTTRINSIDEIRFVSVSNVVFYVFLLKF